jgi:glycosyltransferase involved in cell wall biosynthesis
MVNNKKNKNKQVKQSINTNNINTNNINNNPAQLPFVSVLTPTFNRRPFIPLMIKCFQHQTYPKDRMEWIIIDDGTDKIEELVAHIPQVKYFKYDEKMTLGKKRNLLHKKSKGEIIIYMDDDDYYPPERIEYAVDQLLKNPDKLCAGSSIMYIYFKHIDKMYQFGPYGENHATAATFAFRRKLLEQTTFNDEACLAEEKLFLKNWTIPMIQLDTKKTILVFSHNHNSFDKKQLLYQNIANNPFIKESNLSPSDFIQNQEILRFFLKDIDHLLKYYIPGEPHNKPDVINQMSEINKKREKLQNDRLHQVQQQNIQKQLDSMTILVQELTLENTSLREKANYFENKLKLLIQEKVKTRILEKI